ncbi:hypothetical protein HDF26_004395 [Pedobacter cryoconitis]|uniref:molybdopterin-dependent oxidoreductase n=1 Tax=Pedobacter cryoconitis TaxID=188932 RepID=UPI00161973BF|nr:molybdopterin-dependent oxidoreductase [Pedobacter cryoconitis]MBB6273922.1 hypothetical protein [Pedobacter cryoconitis]
MKTRLLRILFIFALITSPYLIQAQVTRKAALVRIGGEVTQPLTLSDAEFNTFKKTLVNRKDKDGNNHVYSGVVLSDLLWKAGAALGKDLRGGNLNKCLLVEAIDGYQVVFALAELDQAFTDRLIILANEMDGKPLPVADGPFRIIVQDEKKPARCIKQVTGMFVKSTVR